MQFLSAIPGRDVNDQDLVARSNTPPNKRVRLCVHIWSRMRERSLHPGSHPAWVTERNRTTAPQKTADRRRSVSIFPSSCNAFAKGKSPHVRWATRDARERHACAGGVRNITRARRARQQTSSSSNTATMLLPFLSFFVVVRRVGSWKFVCVLCCCCIFSVYLAANVLVSFERVYAQFQRDSAQA